MSSLTALLFRTAINNWSLLKSKHPPTNGVSPVVKQTTFLTKQKDLMLVYARLIDHQKNATNLANLFYDVNRLTTHYNCRFEDLRRHDQACIVIRSANCCQ